ncbi:MAG: CatB-related O-acetyltransferase [Betaproteobacteria bacterium]|nr:CatB-related O-acetyltransferase [Betaproteobacteria bacterium]
MNALMQRLLVLLRDALRRHPPAAAQGSRHDDVPYLKDRYPQYEIGVGSYGPLVVKTWGESSTLRIGSYCSFAAGCQILLGGEHRSDWITTYPFNVLLGHHDLIGQPHSKGNVEIGSDVWVGTNATILSGVTVGDGAIVGAGSVVAKNVEPYAIVVGNPARVIRWRFPNAVISEMLSIRWWDWDRDRLSEALPLLQSDRIDEFIEYARKQNC